MSGVTPYANSVFEQPWYLDIVAPGCWKEAWLTNEQGTPIARWPYVLRKKWYGNSITMPPLTQTLGPWFADRSPQPGNTHLRAQREKIAALISQMPKSVRFEMTLDSENSYILPYRWHGFMITPTFSYRIMDLKNLDIVYSNFYKTAKKNIKTAKNKVSISDSLAIHDLLSLLDQTFAVQNRRNPISHELMTQIIKSAISHQAGKILIARDEHGHAYSGAFLLYDEHTCYYLLGGSDPKYRSSGAQSLVLWESIRFAASVSEHFDFEGSMLEGIEAFFKQFGGQQVINYHLSKSALPFEMVALLKPRIKRLFGYKI